jgi:geranylgeranyl diphosphate synthase type I
MSGTSGSLSRTEIMLQALEKELERALSPLRSEPYLAMAEMIEYHLGWREARPDGRGKRVRPLLTLLSCEASGGQWQLALPAAAAVELIHNFSLIHDDIEDWSATRRGRETVWKRWGVPQAINSGDALFVMARLAALNLSELEVSDECCLEVLHRLDSACLRLTMGQFLDLSFEDWGAIGEAAYMEMIDGKTAALVATATEVGALIGDAPGEAVESSRLYGWHLGMAFQIMDDVLGIWGDSQATGKPSADDLRSRKKTLPVIRGLARSPEFAALWESGAEDPQSLDEMARLIESVGAKTSSRQAAHDHTERALEALERFAKAGAAKEELRRITTKLLKRDR